MTGKEVTSTGIGGKPIVIAIIAIGLAAAIGVAVFIMWRKISAAAIESKVISSDISKSRLEVVQLTNEVKNRDERITTQSDTINRMEKEIFILQRDIEDIKKTLERRDKKKPEIEIDDV